VSTFLIVYISIVLLINTGIVILFIVNHKNYTKTWDELPSISVLLAARNEQENIERCLNSLVSLDYPMHKFQILVGDDASEDVTWRIINEYQMKYPFIQSFLISEQIGEQKGKANVLAQLAQKATGDFLLITDADMQLPSNWIHAMLSAMEENVGLAIGVTQVHKNRMQDMDWLFALGLVKVATDLRLPVTAMGNNMIVSKEAYLSVGGYENLPFSITEDFELFKHIYKKGYQCLHIFNKEVLGKTLPINGFINLLNQRKRWMKGAIDLPWHMVVLLTLQVCFYPCLVILSFMMPVVALKLFIIKAIIQLVFLSLIRKKINRPINPFYILLYEMYAVLMTISSSLYFVLPFKIKWKGREY